MTVIFDGNKFAAERMAVLKEKVLGLERSLKLVSVVFVEDKMGQLYTALKAQAAVGVGIQFEKVEVKFNDDSHQTVEKIGKICARDDVDGVLVQKPSKAQYQELGVNDQRNYGEWWEELTSAIDHRKDVDCLTDKNLDLVYQGKSDFLPATARAVVNILQNNRSRERLSRERVSIVGRSDLVGQPLASYLKNVGMQVDLLGSKDNLGDYLSNADVVISATGKASLITGEMVKDGVVVIDVGEPKGDIEFESVCKKASFITPVPGGVGPVTVVSLLENLIYLESNKD